jgi:hypothetical protein
MSIYVESVVRTNKLHCTDCENKIVKGEEVIFKLNEEHRMKAVYCHLCKKRYEDKALEDTIHPFSSEALGHEELYCILY